MDVQNDINCHLTKKITPRQPHQNVDFQVPNKLHSPLDPWEKINFAGTKIKGP